MLTICCVCGQPRNCTDAIAVTDKMRGAYPKYDFPETLYYCRPCWRLLCDPEKGARLVSSFFQAGITAKGAKDPGKQADKFYKFLVSKAKSGLAT